MSNGLKIYTFNAKGLKGSEKRNKVFSWIETKAPDILMIQESHYEDIDKDKWKKVWDGELYTSPGLGNSRGVCTLISSRVQYTENGVYKVACD
jgi:exonuclease III